MDQSRSLADHIVTQELVDKHTVSVPSVQNPNFAPLVRQREWYKHAIRGASHGLVLSPQAVDLLNMI